MLLGATIITFTFIKRPFNSSLFCHEDGVVCISEVIDISVYSYACAAAAAKSHQSCLTLCDPIDGSLQGSPVPGILQTRTLEWVAISFSKA